MSARIESADRTWLYLLAGKAFVTLVSERTGTRFTYRVSRKEGREPKKGDDSGKIWFVSVLTGQDNVSDYEYVGQVVGVKLNDASNAPLVGSGVFTYGKKSRIGKDAPSVLAFAFLWKALREGRMPVGVEVWHQGRCAKCGKPLTVPESIAMGLGPDCAEGGW